MPPSKLSLEDARLISQCLRELELSLEQSQNLLEDVRKVEINFSALQTELRILCENVRNITPVVQSLVLRMALMEQSIQEHKERISSEAPDKKTLEEVKLEETKGKWQTIGLIVSGVFSTVASIIALILATIN